MLMRRTLAALLALCVSILCGIAVAETVDATVEPEIVELVTEAPAEVSAEAPTAEPAEVTAEVPTAEPTEGPTVVPTEEPTVAPTVEPTPEPLPLEGIIIGIDPGHQTHYNKQQEPMAPGSKKTKKKCSSGTAGVKSRVDEYIVNLQVGLQLRDALEALGCTVIMSRTENDVDISNIERAQMMNEAGVDLWLRIHCDGSENSSKHGIGLFVAKTGDTAKESYRAAEALLPAMAEATGADARGVTKSDNYTGNNWSTRPCILVEMGYLSNVEEDALLVTPEYQAKLVAGMVSGIRSFVDR